MDRLARDPATPPCDALAEAIVLDGLLLCPEAIAHYDLGPLLVFPEHQWIWQAMVRVHMRTPGLRYPWFWFAWLEELKRANPDTWLELSEVVEGWAVDDATWRARQYLRDPLNLCRDWSFEFWVQRIRDCAEARRLIDCAQQVASKAWREDLDGARSVLSMAASKGADPMRVDIPG